MNGAELWNRVVSELPETGEELQTGTGLWFRASSQGGRLYIDSATEHKPSCNLTMQRSISENDFIFVHSYYYRWASGETGVRHEVSRRSRNTAYIFALIGRFDN